MLRDFLLEQADLDSFNENWFAFLEENFFSTSQDIEKSFVFTKKVRREAMVPWKWREDYEREMEKSQFRVDPARRVPKGFKARYDSSSGCYHLFRHSSTGYDRVGAEFQTLERAVSYAKELKKADGAGRKTRFPRPQFKSLIVTGHANPLDEIHEPQELIDTFGLRGIQFGNYLSREDRIQAVSYAYAALTDLSVALDIAPEGISLGGTLGLAFGARGKGNAMAHYEPEARLINLTKNAGMAGTLAHEYGHALHYRLRETHAPKDMKRDLHPSVLALVSAMKEKPLPHEYLLSEVTKEPKKIFSKMEALSEELGDSELLKWIKEKEALFCLNDPLGFTALKEERMISRMPVEMMKINEKAVKAVSYAERKILEDYVKIVSKLVKGVNVYSDTDFYRMSLMFDHRFTREGGYWASDEELFARAFSCFVMDRLEEKGIRNDFLTASSQIHETTFQTSSSNRRLSFEDGTSLYYPLPEKESLVKAYPVSKEREKIDQAFDELIKTARAEAVFLDA